MTVCIAALFDNGKGAVLASDHMITWGIPPMAYEFESDDVSKIRELGDNSYVLHAGNVFDGDLIVQRSQAQIIEEKLVLAEDIANTIAEVYGNVRLHNLEQRYLRPRGLTLNGYYAAQLSLNPGMVQEIDEKLANDGIGVEFLIAGPSAFGYSIYTILHPGIATCVDAIGYGAIGVGASHVFHSLISAPYRKDLGKEQVEKFVLEAKEKSQLSPGVGQQTSTRSLPKEK